MRISDWSSDVCSSDLAQRLPQPLRGGLLQQGGAQRDVREREAAVPEQDGLVGALAARLLPGHDLAELAVQRRLRQLSRLALGAPRTPLAALALAPVVDPPPRHPVRPADRELGKEGVSTGRYR